MTYTLYISKRADKEIQELKKTGNKRALKKLITLLVEITEHPRSGSGQPEGLKYDLSGYWSRRINHKERIVYLIDDKNSIVEIVSILGHYNKR